MSRRDSKRPLESGSSTLTASSPSLTSPGVDEAEDPRAEPQHSHDGRSGIPAHPTEPARILGFPPVSGENFSGTLPRPNPWMRKLRRARLGPRLGMASCQGNALLNQSPIDPNALSNVGPTGNLNSTSHVFQSEHVGHSLKESAHRTIVVAPGDVVIRVSADGSGCRFSRTRDDGRHRSPCLAPRRHGHPVQTLASKGDVSLDAAGRVLGRS